MPEIYLALGSNVGNKEANIKRAIELLSDQLEDVVSAPLYLSKAVGYTEQDNFVNTAISANTALTPEQLLDLIKHTEVKVGRVKRFKWGPREIDIDIIFYGDQIVKNDDLLIPHPYFKERDFVLRPLVDISPQLVDPVTHQSVEDLLTNLQPSSSSILKKL